MIDGHVNSSGDIAAGLSDDGSLAASLSGHGEISGSVNAVGHCSGRMSGTALVSGAIAARSSLTGRISQPDSSSYERYAGPYDITPTTGQQTLRTNDKLMDDDVIVRQIPYYETSNQTGTTVYIGG